MIETDCMVARGRTSSCCRHRFESGLTGQTTLSTWYQPVQNVCYVTLHLSSVADMKHEEQDLNLTSSLLESCPPDQVPVSTSDLGSAAIATTRMVKKKLQRMRFELTRVSTSDFRLEST